ncbi:hypothetical protein [Embleya sp. AB8]|uniref:hypothetical protein n=1 Tax=Embleya sp. AB8 TaxID=3156304 RepID=UPI003C773525
MGELGIALIAAGSALAGGLITGWFTRAAGLRQADAARHAGDRQADALLDTVRSTLAEQRTALDEQRVERLLDLRRQTYLRLLEAADSVSVGQRTGAGSPQDLPALQRALTAVQLEGPAEVTRAAGTLVDTVRRSASPDDLERARQDLIAAARIALASRAAP